MDGCGEQKILLSSGFEPRAVQPVASREIREEVWSICPSARQCPPRGFRRVLSSTAVTLGPQARVPLNGQMYCLATADPPSRESYKMSITEIQKPGKWDVLDGNANATESDRKCPYAYISIIT